MINLMISVQEENARLKMNLLEAEAGRGNCGYDAVGELRELRAHFEVINHKKHFIIMFIIIF